MGRRKSYEREDLISAAMGLFHAHGYQGTSTEMLVETLGVNRNSMYAEFGSKQALFDVSLAHYDRQVFTKVFGGLEAEVVGFDAIDALFADFAASAEGASGLGCMLSNTAVELGGLDPSGARFVERYFERLHAALRNALEGARRAGVLADGVDIADEAHFLGATCLGIFVMVRGRADPTTVAAATRAARRHVGLLAVAAPTRSRNGASPPT